MTRMEPLAARYMFAILLKERPDSELEALRQKHEIPAWHPRIPLHITLIRPFDTTLSPDEVAQQAMPVAARHSTFPLELNGLGRFDHHESILYVHVEQSPELSALQHDLWKAFEGFVGRPKFSFTPHITISGEATAEQVTDYMARLSQVRIRYTMPCDRLTLLRKDAAAQQWLAIREFPLQ